MERLIDSLKRGIRIPERQNRAAGRDAGRSVPDQEDLVSAVNVTKGVEIASRVTWAGTSEARRRGLLGKNRIETDEGMYIVPTQWIHMFGMRFPIDVAFLAEDGTVLFVHHKLKPNRLSRLVWRAAGALELAPGALEKTDTTVGDVIELR
ncbi:MAG: DUF192 domain-containing protein [bacterium]